MKSLSFATQKKATEQSNGWNEKVGLTNLK